MCVAVDVVVCVCVCYSNYGGVYVGIPADLSGVPAVLFPSSHTGM